MSSINTSPFCNGREDGGDITSAYPPWSAAPTTYGALSAPSSIAVRRNSRKTASSGMPSLRNSGAAANAADPIAQMCSSFSTSAGVFTIRKLCTRPVASAICMPGKAAIRRSQSARGIRRQVSCPFIIPIHSRFLASGESISISRLIPSSFGLGAGQVRTSSSQPLRINSAPISGMTAIGLPSAGINKNHGRVGLCQNRVLNPLK